MRLLKLPKHLEEQLPLEVQAARRLYFESEEVKARGCDNNGNK